MYEKYFGLDHRPFSITPDPRFLFLGERHRDALAHLVYGVSEGGGFVQLTGEVGTGKTTLCRTLLEQLPERVDIALILNPCLNAIELVAAVCDELRVSYPARSRSIKALVDALNAHLLKAHAGGRRTVLIIDEAQDLSPEVLEQVRLLTNLETTEEKLLQIILIGQPELREMLARDDLRQLAQRITARYHLEPLTREESAAYVQHRLQVAGASRLIFTSAALAVLHRLSGGIPRLVNIIADRALLGAYAEERSEVDASIVRRAAHEVREHGGPSPVRNGALVSGVLIVLLMAVVGLGYLQSTLPGPEPGTTGQGDLAGTVMAEAATSGISSEAAGDAIGRLIAGGDGDEAEAWRALYALWDIRDVVVPGDCTQPLPDGLRCIVGGGNWNLLARMNRPALLTIRNASGGKGVVLLSAIEGGEVELHVDGRTHRVPISRIDPYWQGEYQVVWRPPVDSQLLREGMRSPDVVNLRALLLNILPDEATAVAEPALFDEALKRQVMAFQRRQDLFQDGIVGPQTLFWLDVATSDSQTPHLVPVAKEGG